MDGENNGNSLLKWMIWGYHYFRKHPFCPPEVERSLNNSLVDTKKTPHQFLSTFREGTISRHHFGGRQKPIDFDSCDLDVFFLWQMKRTCEGSWWLANCELWTVPHVLYLCIPSQWLGPMGFGLSGFRKFVHSSRLRPKLGPPNM